MAAAPTPGRTRRHRLPFLKAATVVDVPPDQPIARTLLGADLQARKGSISGELFTHVLERQPDDGFAYWYPSEEPCLA